MDKKWTTVRFPVDEREALNELAWRARTSQSRALRVAVRMLCDLSREQLHAAAENLAYEQPARSPGPDEKTSGPIPEVFRRTRGTSRELNDVNGTQNT